MFTMSVHDWTEKGWMTNFNFISVADQDPYGETFRRTNVFWPNNGQGTAEKQKRKEKKRRDKKRKAEKREGKEKKQKTGKKKREKRERSGPAAKET